MTFTDLVKNRYSCRKYTDRKPTRDELLEILEIAHLAPSAKNLQPWKYVLVDEAGMLKKIKGAYAREWISSAPAVIVVCGDFENAWHRPADGKVHTDVDVAITVDHLTLAATEKGMATCWICMFDPAEVKEILNIPDKWEAVAMIPIGFPEDKPNTERHERLRKPLSEILSYNKF